MAILRVDFQVDDDLAQPPRIPSEVADGIIRGSLAYDIVRTVWSSVDEAEADVSAEDVEGDDEPTTWFSVSGSDPEGLGRLFSQAVEDQLIRRRLTGTFPRSIPDQKPPIWEKPDRGIVQPVVTCVVVGTAVGITAGAMAAEWLRRQWERRHG